MNQFKKKLAICLSATLVMSTALIMIFNTVAGQRAEAINSAEDASKNKNYIFQLPSDGFAIGTLEKYATLDSNRNVTALNLPDTVQIEQDVKTYLDNYIADTQIGRVFFNVNYSRSMIPSDCYDTMAYNVDTGIDGQLQSDTKTLISKATKFGEVQYYWYTLQAGIDIIDMGIDYVNEHGIEAWASLRMNDHHYPEDSSVNSAVRIQYKDTWGVNQSAIFMDYTNEAVQTYYLNYIKEICTNYDIAGVELDFLRTAPYMSVVNAENMQKLTDFVSTVKAEIQTIGETKGKNLKLAVRTYATEELNQSYGMDPASWVANGYVDVLTVANFYQPTSFDLPIQEWKTSIESKNGSAKDYAVIAGLDWGVKANPNYYMYMTPAHTRGFTSAAYANGADGIYLFNMFQTDGYSTYEYTIHEDGSVTNENIFKERLMASDSLEVAESGDRRYVYGYFSTYTDYWATIPRTVTGYSSTTFTMQTGTAPTDGYYIVAIGIDDLRGYDQDNLTVAINGKPIAQISDMKRSNSLPYVEASSERAVNHITQTAPRMLQFAVTDLSILNDGYNQISVMNGSMNPQQIVWLEVFAGNNVVE